MVALHYVELKQHDTKDPEGHKSTMKVQSQEDWITLFRDPHQGKSSEEKQGSKHPQLLLGYDQGAKRERGEWQCCGFHPGADMIIIL